MPQPYTNLLTISPYLCDRHTRADGQKNNGFKNLITHPELLHHVPELASDPALHAVISALNFGDPHFFTTGCCSRCVEQDQTYQYNGYLEFAWNCQTRVRDAIYFFSLFFHFEHFLQCVPFDRSIHFHWMIEETQFLDIDISGFCCAVFFHTAFHATKSQAYDDWQSALQVFEAFLATITAQPTKPLYSPQIPAKPLVQAGITAASRFHLNEQPIQRA
jgi:hypothetical protein